MWRHSPGACQFFSFLLSRFILDLHFFVDSMNHCWINRTSIVNKCARNILDVFHTFFESNSNVQYFSRAIWSCWPYEGTINKNRVHIVCILVLDFGSELGPLVDS